MKKQFLNYYEILSQVWFNKYTIILVLMTIKIYLFTNSILSNLTNFKAYTESICTSLDTYSTVIASLPEQLSKVINHMVASTLNSMKMQSLKMLMTIITIIKLLIVFYIDIFLGTYICILTAAIGGTVDFALDSTQLVLKSVNETIISVSEDIQDGLNGLLKVINTLLSGVDKVKSFFTNQDTDSTEYVDKVNLSIKALQNIKIPNSVLTDIDNFKDKVPDFNELQNTSKLVSKPFEIITQELNELAHFKNITVDQLKLASTPPVNFCSNSLDIDKFYSNLAKKVQFTSNIIIIVLLIMAMFAIASLVVVEYFKWRKSQRMINEILADKNQESYFVLTRNIMNKYNSSLIYYIEKFVTIPPSRKDNLYWLLSYITTPYSLTVLIIGLAGLFTVMLQFIILQIILKSFKSLTTELTGFKTQIITLMDNATSSYIKETNSYIGSQQKLINDELFGNIRTASTSVNSTINDFLMKMNTTINSVFANTPFSKPVNTLVYCTIGRKLIKIEQGLTWIVENLSVSLPQLPKNLTEDFMTNYSKDNHGIHKLTDNVTSGITFLLDTYKKSLLIELYISSAILGIWILQIIIGLTLIWYRSSSNCKARKPEKIQGEPTIGNPKPLTTEQRKEYGYPHIDPFNEKVDASSSIYSL